MVLESDDEGRQPAFLGQRSQMGEQKLMPLVHPVKKTYGGYPIHRTRYTVRLTPPSNSLWLYRTGVRHPG